MSSLPEANKSLGQHFLKDQKVIQLITDNFVSEADALLEIGPGPGILTQHLAKHDLPLHVIEKDERFPILIKKFIAEENIHLADAIECDYQSFIQEHYQYANKLWLISNLPYNVGSLIYVKALQTQSIHCMTLMFQREVADKIFAIDTREGKAMNSLMALSQTYCDVKLLCKVPPGAFSPPPKVESAVLSFVKKSDPVVELSDFKAYEKFLRSLFRQKRKQMGKVLTMSYSKDMIEQVLERLNLSRALRAESLDLATIQQLYLTFRDIKNGN
jgi:16S rRNA (adenine1518-N6/adenine1519-N6)-dimethyltransferase